MRRPGPCSPRWVFSTFWTGWPKRRRSWRSGAAMPTGPRASRSIWSESAGGRATPKGPPPPVPSPDVDLHVGLVGPTEVYRTPGRPIPASAWKIRRALQIFCYLASSRGRRATKDRIVDALWGDARLSVIDKNFHPTISFLRRALNFGHNVPKNFIVCERGAYLLNPDYRYDLDTERFETLVRSARGRKAAGQARQAVADYEAALALYRGPFLEEEYEEWAEA